MDALEREKQQVHRAKRDPSAFKPLYEKYYGRILRYVQKRVSSKSVAEDIVSDTFEKALRNLSSYRWQGATIAAWLYRIARNTTFDYYRSSERKCMAVLDEDDENLPSAERSTEMEVADREKELELYRVLATLGRDDQYLLYYWYFEGMGAKEVSKKTGLSEANVATRLHRLRKQLGQLLQGLDD